MWGCRTFKPLNKRILGSTHLSTCLFLQFNCAASILTKASPSRNPARRLMLDLRDSQHSITQAGERAWCMKMQRTSSVFFFLQTDWAGHLSRDSSHSGNFHWLIYCRADSRLHDLSQPCKTLRTMQLCGIQSLSTVDISKMNEVIQANSKMCWPKSKFHIRHMDKVSVWKSQFFVFHFNAVNNRDLLKVLYQLWTVFYMSGSQPTSEFTQAHQC